MTETNAAWVPLYPAIAFNRAPAVDPVRAAAAKIALTRHLVLGAFGIDVVTKKLRASLPEIEVWWETGLLTDFPPAS